MHAGYGTIRCVAQMMESPVVFTLTETLLVLHKYGLNQNRPVRKSDDCSHIHLPHIPFLLILAKCNLA